MESIGLSAQDMQVLIDTVCYVVSVGVLVGFMSGVASAPWIYQITVKIYRYIRFKTRAIRRNNKTKGNINETSKNTIPVLSDPCRGNRAADVNYRMRVDVDHKY